MHATATVKTLGSTGLAGPTPLLRLQTDERLVALTRRGNESAYEVLVARYQSRLQSFCRHMLSSKEDAEDVLQEVFAAAYNALLADNRPVNLRPWLYRIARNRCLNHLRKRTAIGVDSMDIHLADHGTTTADLVHQREEFRQLVGDVQTLPESQRTALLLREIDALSYDQIAEAMDTTVPSIKSLLVRARVSLAEAAEARTLTCAEVREELGAVAEGIATSTAPVRRHLKDCTRCTAFKKHLKQTNKQLAAIFPLGPLLLLKKFLIAHAGVGASGAAAATSSASSTAVSAGVSAVASKAVAGMAAAALVTAGAVEVDHASTSRALRAATPVYASIAPPKETEQPVVVEHSAQPVVSAEPEPAPEVQPVTPVTTVQATPVTPTATVTTPPQQQTDTTSLPPQTVSTTTPTTPVETTPTEEPPPAETTPTEPTPTEPPATTTVPVAEPVVEP